MGRTPWISLFRPKCLPKPLRNDLLTSIATFLPSDPFRNPNLQIFDPPELSKSSIFIERVVIFEISMFPFEYLLLCFLAASWPQFWCLLGPPGGFLGASWGHLGASWGLPVGFLGVSWGILVENWARERPKDLLGGLPGRPWGSPGGLLGASREPLGCFLRTFCLLAS